MFNFGSDYFLIKCSTEMEMLDWSTTINYYQQQTEGRIHSDYSSKRSSQDSGNSQDFLYVQNRNIYEIRKSFIKFT
jgi:hypothetical protein